MLIFQELLKKIDIPQDSSCPSVSHLASEWAKRSQHFFQPSICKPRPNDSYISTQKIARFTVITPPRYNAPDMTPPTTRLKELGTFTTRLKNEAAYICDDHGFYSNSQNVTIISKYHCRYVLGALYLGGVMTSFRSQHCVTRHVACVWPHVGFCKSN